MQVNLSLSRHQMPKVPQMRVHSSLPQHRNQKIYQNRPTSPALLQTPARSSPALHRSSTWLQHRMHWKHRMRAHFASL